MIDCRLFLSRGFLTIISLRLNPPNNPTRKSTSAYRPWRRPRLTSDIQPLRRLFDESPPVVNLPPILEQQQQQQNQPHSEPSTPTNATAEIGTAVGTGSVIDLSKLVGAESDEEEPAIKELVPQIRVGSGGSQKRSSSLNTAMLSSQLSGTSMGNLHVITTTSASGTVTRSYFFAQRLAFELRVLSAVCLFAVYCCC